MELGNAIFGNSRGEYKVPRENCKWADKFYQLINKIEEKIDESDMRVPEFENEVFWTFSYYWGDCTCGWWFVDDGHKKLDNLEHKEYCFQSELEEAKEYYKRHFGSTFNLPEDWKGRNVNKEYREKVKKLAKEHNLKIDGGLHYKCDCDYYDRKKKVIQEYIEEFGSRGHTQDCLLVKPNFHYKTDNFKINWYKYPFRDSYMNKKYNFEQFSEVVDKCIESLKE